MTRRAQNFLLFLCPLLIYFPSFKYFFFQDDFFHLKRSFINNLGGFLQFFVPSNDVIYYRPLPIQVYFYLTRVIFGLNPLAFRLIAFLFFLLSILLVKKVIKKITKDDLLGTAVSFLFAISSIHFMSIFWISAFSVILGIFFFFLSLLYYPKKRALLFFLLGLLSHELVIVLPLLLTLYEIFLKKRSLKNLRPFFVLTVCYLFLRFLIFPIPIKGTYTPILAKKNFNTFIWYLLWSFNLPEELKYQAISLIIIRKEFIVNFLKEFIIWVSFLFVVFTFSIILPLLSRQKPSLVPRSKKILFFGLGWFLIIILPLVFVPEHQYQMYLTFALPGLYLALFTWYFAYLKNFQERIQRIVLIFLLSGFFIISLITVRFTEKTHWLVREANQAEMAISKARKLYPQVPENTIFILPNEAFLKTSINDQDALQVFYGRKIKTSYVNGKDFIKYKSKKNLKELKKELGEFRVLDL